MAISFAQEPGYRISGNLDNYSEDTIYLGYYFADKQYLIDTTTVIEGSFTFEGMDTLKAGVYLIVMPPDNKFFQIMVSEEEDHFSFQADMSNIEQSISFEGSTDNTLFYENLKFIGLKRQELSEINARKEQASEEEKPEIDTLIARMNQEVMDYQHSLVDKNPNSITAALIKSGFQINLPEFEGTKEEINMQQYLFYKKTLL